MLCFYVYISHMSCMLQLLSLHYCEENTLSMNLTVPFYFFSLSKFDVGPSLRFFLLSVGGLPYLPFLYYNISFLINNTFLFLLYTHTYILICACVETNWSKINMGYSFLAASGMMAAFAVGLMLTSAFETEHILILY